MPDSSSRSDKLRNALMGDLEQLACIAES